MLTTDKIYELFILKIVDQLIEQTGNDSFDHLYVSKKSNSKQTKHRIYGWALKDNKKYTSKIDWENKPSADNVIDLFKAKFKDHDKISII